MSEARSMQELAPLIIETVNAGGEFKLITKGTSMMPLLRNGVDTAVLVKFDGNLKKNDIPLYCRADGQYVLHRAIEVSSDTNSFTALGDNQTVVEKNVPVSSVIAVMTAVIVNGVRRDFDGAEYRSYVKKLPFHRLRLRITRKIRSMLK